MHQIINSLLDSDLYKMTQQWFVLQTYPDVEVEYCFNNRDKSMMFTQEAVDEIKKQIHLLGTLKLQDAEYDWMKTNLPFLPVTYRQYLAAYRFNPKQVEVVLDENKQLQMTVRGPWRDTILFEVPLMAIVSEVYFAMIDTDWTMGGQVQLAKTKAETLSDHHCLFADFGTRRRRNFLTQDMVVETMKSTSGFVGTSNPYLAMKHKVKALGTVAHEAISATAILESMNHPNKYFMENWTNVYKGDLGTMLPDTFGIDSFLKDFSLEKAMLWSGVRHDSGDPKVFTNKIINHYNNLKIDTTTKTIVFSDGLDVLKAIELNEYCFGRIRCSFGIGTFFTNDFRKKSTGDMMRSKPLNMVIKLKTVNCLPAVKLSDSPTKAIGDPEAVRVAMWLHFGKKLD